MLLQFLKSNYTVNERPLESPICKGPFTQGNKYRCDKKSLSDIGHYIFHTRRLLVARFYQCCIDVLQVYLWIFENLVLSHDFMSQWHIVSCERAFIVNDHIKLRLMQFINDDSFFGDACWLLLTAIAMGNLELDSFSSR